MKEPIKTGVLSFGLSGRVFHAPFLSLHKGFVLSAITERSRKIARGIYPEVISYDSVDELIADPAIELVVVNTPNTTHYEYSLKALRAGKHVILEKPLTVTSSEARDLYKEAERNHRLLLPYQNRRWDSDFISVRNVVESGVLGRLVEVHMRFDRYRIPISPKAAKEQPLPGSGISWDLGPHLLDGAISLFGMPVRWHKSLGRFRPGTQVDDYAFIHLLYPDDLQVFVTTSLLIADMQPAFIIRGVRGSYVKHRADRQEEQLVSGMNPDNPHFGEEYAGMEGLLTLVDDDGTKREERIRSIKSSYMHIFNAVYESVRDNKPFPVTPEQVMKQLEILEG